MMNLTDKTLGVGRQTKNSLCYMILFINVQGEQTQFHSDKIRIMVIIRGVLTWKEKEGDLCKYSISYLLHG